MPQALKIPGAKAVIKMSKKGQKVVKMVTKVVNIVKKW